MTSDADVCDPTWEGVYCGTIEGDLRVVGVDMTGNSISGSFPTELGLLDQAQGLLMGSNDITGTIPTQVMRLCSSCLPGRPSACCERGCEAWHPARPDRYHPPSPPRSWE